MRIRVQIQEIFKFENPTPFQTLATIDPICEFTIQLCMGGGTFFKVVGGGTTARQNNYRKILWFELETVTSHALKYDVIVKTPSEGLIHYFRQNYSTVITYQWTPWNSNTLL